TDAGLNHMPAGADGEFRHYRHKADDPASLTSDRIYYIIEDPAGMIWAGSSNGLNRVDPETGEVKRFLYDEKQEVIFGAGSVVDLYFPPESPGIVWLATG